MNWLMDNRNFTFLLALPSGRSDYIPGPHIPTSINYRVYSYHQNLWEKLEWWRTSATDNIPKAPQSFRISESFHLFLFFLQGISTPLLLIHITISSLHFISRSGLVATSPWAPNIKKMIPCLTRMRYQNAMQYWVIRFLFQESSS